MEFERQRWYIRQGLKRAATESRSVEEIVDEYERELICPLVLRPEETWLEPEGSRSFEAHVPYAGDDELWHLYPGEVHLTGIDGEVFRCELILTAYGNSEGEALAAAMEKVETIQSIVSRQAARIEAFHDSLAEYIRIELHKLRRRGSWVSGKPLLGWKGHISGGG